MRDSLFSLTPDPSPKGRGEKEWLARYPWLPIVLLLVLPWAVHLPQWLLGLSTDPIWQNSGVVLGTHLGLFNGLPNADPNAGWTTEALGRLAARDWLNGIVPWWNPYAGIGLPLAGEMQPAAFFFPFLLLLLLKGGVLWLAIALETTAGLAAYALARELGLGRMAALAAGALFALNGTLAWFAHAPAFPVPFLAVLLFGIERSRRAGSPTAGSHRALRDGVPGSRVGSPADRGAAGIFWTGIGLGWLILAGFPETAYIGGLFALLWVLFRLVSAGSGRGRFTLRIAAGGVLGLMIAAPQLVAFIDYLGLSEITHQYRMGALDPSWHAFAMWFMPYVYGPLTQFWGNRKLWVIWGLSGGYVGVVVPLLALRAVLPARYANPPDRGLRLFLLGWVLVALAKIFAVAPVQTLLNHIPFLLQVDFARYAAPSIELAMILLAAFALDDLARERWKLFLPFAVLLLLLVISVALAWPEFTFFAWDRAMRARMFGLLWIALGMALLFLALCLGVRLFTSPSRGRTLLALAAIAEAALLFAAPELNGLHPGRTDKPAIHYLAGHLGLGRFYSAGPLQPNYGGYFGLAGINYTTAPTPALWVRYVERKLYPPLAGTLGEIFWSGMAQDRSVGWRELLGHLSNYEALGVRFLLTDPDVTLQPEIALETGQSQGRSLELGPGETATVWFPAAAPPAKAPGIAAIGILIGNYFGSSDGTLAVSICDQARCSTGSRSLAASRDDQMFFVPLQHPLAADAGARIQLRIRNARATRPVALWLAAAADDGVQALNGPAGPIAGQMPRLLLRYRLADFPLRQVYSDNVMTIWALPAPKPYFAMVRGGPCALHGIDRQTLETRCEAPAILLRRELTMPGWRAMVNGRTTTLRVSNEIFQSVVLPAGNSRIRFTFSPPGIAWAWLAAAIGALGFTLVIAAMLRERKDAEEDAGESRSRY